MTTIRNLQTNLINLKKITKKMLIENPKTYKGQEADTIFFRPSFCGKSAEELGIRVLYNLPVPTTVQVWSHAGNVLQKYAGGWNGGSKSKKFQKTIDMRKVKAETSFAASDYFSMVFEQITGSADVNMGDLTGTDLEKAETELFRRAIAESVRATMWLGDTTGQVSSFTTFNGFLKAIKDASEEGVIDNSGMAYSQYEELDSAMLTFDTVWNAAAEELKSLRPEGNLAYFATSDVVRLYESELDSSTTEAAYRERIDGRAGLSYHGIPVIEVALGKYDAQQKYGKSFCMLTDRRNMVLALNTADMPENEVRMWYNPDEMENRQRAVFLAGADILDTRIVSVCMIGIE